VATGPDPTPVGIGKAAGSRSSRLSINRSCPSNVLTLRFEVTAMDENLASEPWDSR